MATKTKKPLLERAFESGRRAGQKVNPARFKTPYSEQPPECKAALKAIVSYAKRYQ